MKQELLMVRKEGEPWLRPYGGAEAWEPFERIRRDKAVLVTIEQPRNPDHHRKLWALATVVAESAGHFRDAEDAVEWVKLHVRGMHRSYRLIRGTPVITTRSINFASMDQLKFNEFYDRAVELWSKLLGCDVETLLEQVDG